MQLAYIWCHGKVLCILRNQTESNSVTCIHITITSTIIAVKGKPLTFPKSESKHTHLNFGAHQCQEVYACNLDSSAPCEMESHYAEIQNEYVI